MCVNRWDCAIAWPTPGRWCACRTPTHPGAMVSQHELQRWLQAFHPGSVGHLGRRSGVLLPVDRDPVSDPDELVQARPRPTLHGAAGAGRAGAIMRSATEECRTIVQDYARWEGSLRDFLSDEAKRLRLAPTAIRRVLTITAMISSKPHKAPRYRGSTERQTPGAILVTDGKAVEVVSSASGEISHYNWQAMVDQATACHTAVVITEKRMRTGCPAGLRAELRLSGVYPPGIDTRQQAHPPGSGTQGGHRAGHTHDTRHARAC